MKTRSTPSASLVLTLVGAALALMLFCPQGVDAQISCYTCYILTVPDPDGGVFREPYCWSFGDGHGWRNCTEVGQSCWLAYSCSVFTGDGTPRQVELTLPGEFPAKDSVLLVDVDSVDSTNCSMNGVRRVEPAADVVYTF